MKIHIKNYQRLEDLEIDLLPGINLISGSSNNGKSSTIRAVRDFIFNKISKDKIKHGETEVLVSIDNATAIRDSKGVVYEVDGNKFEKVGRNILPEIKDKFNIDELVINGVAIKPNFWFQMDKPFLIDKTAGQKNDLLIGTKNDKYIKCLKNIKAEQLELSKVTKKALEETIDTLKLSNLNKKKQIESLNGIEEIIDKINNFETKRKCFDNMYNIFIELKQSNKELKELKLKLENLNKIKNERIYELQNSLEKTKSRMNDIYSVYKEYKKWNTIEDQTEKDNETLSRILIQANYINEELSPKYSSLYEKYIELDNKMNDYEQGITATERIENILKDKITLLENTKTEFEKFKKELGICPLCEGKL